MIQRLTSRTWRLLHAFRRDTAGAMAVMVLLLIPVMVGMMGLTVDVGIWYSHKRGMQDAVDAAAMAGGADLANGGDQASAQVAAQADADRNGFVAATDTLEVRVPPETGNSIGEEGSVEVILSRTLPLFFTTIFLNQPFTAQVRAVVNTDFVDEFCILGLDPTAAKAVNIFGGGSATLNCGIAVNSSADNALSVTGNAFLSTTTVTTVGGIDIGGTLEVDSPPRRGAAVEDPYDDLVIPSFDPTDCDRDGGNKEYTAIDGETFKAGGGIFVICGGLKVSSGDTLFLESGTYILDQGDFLINGNSFIFGEDVTFILTNSDDPDDVGSVSVNGGGTVELSAPTSDLTDADGYSGVLFYQDRAGDTKSNKSNTFNGGAEVDLQGVLYFPSNDLDFSGGAEAGSGCMQLISLTVNIGGSAGVQGNCDNAGTRKVGRLKASLGE